MSRRMWKKSSLSVDIWNKEDWTCRWMLLRRYGIQNFVQTRMSVHIRPNVAVGEEVRWKHAFWDKKIWSIEQETNGRIFPVEMSETMKPSVPGIGGSFSNKEDDDDRCQISTLSSSCVFEMSFQLNVVDVDIRCKLGRDRASATRLLDTFT